jgi:predicted lipid-binding transport protein (Tim44 family)
LGQRFWNGWFGGLAGGLVIETASHHYHTNGWAGFGLTLLTALAGGATAVVFGA